MPVAAPCPDASVLRRFALGQMPPRELEPLARHVERCEHCTRALDSLKTEDTLLSAMSAQATAGEEPHAAAVAALIERLRRTPPPAVPHPEATAAETPSSHSAAFDTPPPPAAPPGDTNAREPHDFLTPPQGPGEIGRLGGYRVLRLLGAGGMGMVYQAEDVHLQRPIALKVMKSEIARNPTARERFLREAPAAARLKSDHVVTIHQVGEDNGVVFLAMEFLEGMSLEEWLKKDRRPAPAQAARIGRQIALGLAAAHERGLIHRDVKPGNVWLESAHQGRVKLLDFGLARGAADDHQLTQSGAIVGTPAYMAPEQARGAKVDARADLFSLGCLLYRLCTGRPPFRGENTMAVLSALAMDTPTPPREINPDIPPRLAALVERLLSKDRQRRPATARAVAAELAAIEHEQVPAIRPPARDERTVALEPKPAPQPAGSVGQVANLPAGWQPPPRLLVAAGLLFVLAAALTAGIVVIIRDKQGKEVARVTVPEGGDVQIKDDAKDKTKEGPAPKEGVRIEPEPLALLLPGEPLAAFAPVAQPAKLPGVRTWTIATREAWAISAAAYRPDGKRLAVASWDGSIRIWEPQTGRLVQVLFAAVPWSLAWSPDGRVLALGSGGSKRCTELWDAETGRLLRALETPAVDFIFALAWSPDGGRVLAWGKQKSCVTWDAAKGKLLHEAPMKCESAAFSADGKRLAGIGDGNRVVVWDTETGKEVHKLSAPAPIWRLAWSPDGKRLASSGQDGLHVWDAQTAAETFHRKEAVLRDNVPAWSPDGRSLAYSLEANAEVALVEVAPGAEPRPLEDRGNSIIAWSPDGKTLARINPYPWVRLYDATTGRGLRTLTDGRPIDRFAWSPDGQTLAVSDEHDTFLSSADTGQVSAELKGTTGALAWSPDGKHLATAGPDNAVLVYGPDGKVRLTLPGHEAKVTSLAWSPDGKRLASTAAGEKWVLLWDAEKGERDRELGPFPGVAEKVQWSADGRVVACNVPDVGWHARDVEQNRLVNDPKQWKAIAFSLAPDGRSALAAPSEGDVYRLRDLATGKERGQLPHAHHPYLSPPIWSPDGRLLAAANHTSIELWRADLHNRVRMLQGNWTGRQFAFAWDGQLGAVLTGDCLHIWETDTGRLRGVLMLGRPYNGLTITPDGHYTGNDQVERGIVMVVQREDGTQEVLEPADFERKYGFKNEPDKVHLLQPLPPPLYPLPGQPLGPLALLREPAELADPNATSWTVETRSARAQVRAVAYRPDGKLLATGGDDGTIRLWDSTTGELVRMLVGDPVNSLSWSKDGKVLAAGSGGSWAASLWEADTGRLLRRLHGGYNLAWSPDGQTLARLDNRPRLELWDRATERVVRSYDFPSTGQALAWSPDGKTLAVGLGDKTVRLWDVLSAKEAGKLEGHPDGPVSGLAWSPDGKRLVTVAAKEPVLRVWEAASGKLLGRFALAAEPAPTVAWSPDGKAVALGFQPGVHLVDPETGRAIHSLDAGDGVLAVAWSPDGKQVATAGEHGVSLHDAATGKRASTPEVLPDRWSLWSLAWSPDGRRLGFGSYSGAPVMVVEAATGRRCPVPAETQYAVTWSPDGKLLAARGAGWKARLWDAVTLQPVRTLDGQVQGSFWPAWSADSKKLAISHSSGLGVWSAETGKLLWQTEKPAVWPAWSPDGRWLATNDMADKAVRLWEADNGKLVHEAPFFAWNLAWSPDSKTLAAGNGGAQGEDCLLIDAASGAVRVKMKGGLPLWSSDGKTVHTVPWWGELRAYDAATGAQRWAVPVSRLPPTPPVAPSGWSADGRVLALSNGCEVHLWDRDGQPLGVLLLPGQPLADLAVTADGHYRGSARVEREIRMVVQKRDGTSETLTPAEFEQKYGFPNDPDKVRLTRE